jgi:hypothetical protein
MKNFLKKTFGWLVDLVFVPIKVITSFVKNADSILTKLIRLLLLLVFVGVVTYVFVAKPYAVISSDFRIQKYKTNQEAREELTKKYPLNSTNVTTYEKLFKKNNIFCRNEKKEDRDTKVCEGYENRILVRYHWTFIFSLSRKNNVRAVNVSVTRQKVDNSFLALYKKILKK